MSAVFVIVWSSLALADAPGEALARSVAAANGDVYGVDSVSFTFIVEAGGTEKARRSHEWDRLAGTVRVTVGDQTTTLTGLHAVDPSPGVADPAARAELWASIAPGATPEAAAKAWSAWINDSYWLLAAGKVLDDGVVRTVDTEGRLVLTFDGVGLTPGDTYTLTVDPTTHQVQAWDFVLQSGREGRFEWTDYTTVGPLTLSMRRATEAGDFVIRFSDVSVSTQAGAATSL